MQESAIRAGARSVVLKDEPLMAAIGVGLAVLLGMVAGYLAWSILTDSWEHSWAVWPVAGILYGAVVSLLHLLDAAGRRGVRRDV